jgi:hypothetical protein
MSQKDKVETFIQQLFQKGKGGSLSKQNILSQVEKAQFAADIVIFFKELPDQSFSEDSLIDQLNSTIEKRGRADAIGGLLRKPVQAR